MSFQRERTNDIKMPSERHDVDVVCGVIYKSNGFSAEQITINMLHQEGEMFRFDASKRI
jgi:hypothetical protein